jgi:hypothetical protein
VRSACCGISCEKPGTSASSAKRLPCEPVHAVAMVHAATIAPAINDRGAAGTLIWMVMLECADDWAGGGSIPAILRARRRRTSRGMGRQCPAILWMTGHCFVEPARPRRMPAVRSGDVGDPEQAGVPDDAYAGEQCAELGVSMQVETLLN